MLLIEKISDCYWGRLGMFVVGKSPFLDGQPVEFFQAMSRTALLKSTRKIRPVKILKIETLKTQTENKTYIFCLSMTDAPAFEEIVGGTLEIEKKGFLHTMGQILGFK